ncbi:hypothetical protein VNO78_30997 [Psophocarpus tetragonolobus]|uniref:S-protein homolog n=1 Tax=Psophocarpus tetragonolobus TaxID=3891 RepID=A0AAN9RXY2_PSOTE
MRLGRMSALLLLVCVVPTMVSAIRTHLEPFHVEGRIFRDPSADFDTSLSPYIAEVTLQCKHSRHTKHIIYTKNVTTDSLGTFTVFLDAKIHKQNCDKQVF